jgi:hypothetical protein
MALSRPATEPMWLRLSFVSIIIVRRMAAVFSPFTEGVREIL